ncbi:hypothetical protein EJB05_14796, partial [Eragrostis curvula]
MAEPAPPALLYKLVEEILLRLPPDDPALLVRAALACKAWCRLLSDPGFRQRHRTPPVLGVIENVTLDGPFQFPIARFVPTSSFRPTRATHSGWRALDSRHGRVLLQSWHCRFASITAFAVWNPLTDHFRQLIGLSQLPCRNWKAALLCAAAAGDCDHLDCSRRPFIVVLLGNSSDGGMSAYVYSSETHVWSERTSAPHHGFLLSDQHGAHVGNAIYYLVFPDASTRRILMCDIGTLEMSVIQPPPMSKDLILLMTAEGGGLGSVTLEGSRLYLWSREPGPDGDVGWARIKVIEFDMLASAGAYVRSFRIASFADGISIVYLGTNYGSFTIDLKSERVTKIAKLTGFEDVALYTSFYTPEFKVASTGEGPRDGASSA